MKTIHVLLLGTLVLPLYLACDTPASGQAKVEPTTLRTAIFAVH